MACRAFIIENTTGRLSQFKNWSAYNELTKAFSDNYVYYVLFFQNKMFHEILPQTFETVVSFD